MSIADTLQLFRDVGIVLVFIAFLIWLVRYFMGELQIWRKERKEIEGKILEVIENHLQKSNEMMAQQQHAFELLTQRIEIFTKVRSTFSQEISPSTSQSENR